MAPTRLEKLKECLAIAQAKGNAFMAQNIEEEIQFELKRIKLEERAKEFGS